LQRVYVSVSFKPLSMLHAAPPVMPSPHDVNTLVHSLTTRSFNEK